MAFPNLHASLTSIQFRSIAALDRRDALAQRAADSDDLPGRIVFDPPDPISDTARIAARSTDNQQILNPEIEEGRA